MAAAAAAAAGTSYYLAIHTPGSNPSSCHRKFVILSFPPFSSTSNRSSSLRLNLPPSNSNSNSNPNPNLRSRRTRPTVVSATTADTPRKSGKRYPGEAKGFVEEMRFVAMRLHTKDQAKEGERESSSAPGPIAKLQVTLPNYLRFLVDSKLVHDTLEDIVRNAASPSYGEFRNTGLERSENLAKDLEWFKEQGHAIPEPSTPGTEYALFLKEISENDPQAFICHFYNVYFAHSAGGRMIGKKVSEKILDSKELEFYKWDGELSELLQNVRDKINEIADSWSREEKDHCLEQTEKSFKYSGEILKLILS